MGAFLATAGGALATAGSAKGQEANRAFSDPRSGAALNREAARKVGGDAGSTTGDATTRIHPSAVNNASGDTTAQDTQSETSIAANGSKTVIAFNDSGSFTGGSNHFTGYAFTGTGGLGWTDAGTLPASAVGDAGDPVLAVDNGTGAFYLSTLGFSSANAIQVFKS